MLQQLQQDDNV